MDSPSPRPQPAGKSKTDLRRGQFTPGNPAAPQKSPAPQRNAATTKAEQALLFGEDFGRVK